MDAASTDGCNSGLHAGKRSEGKVSLPLCSLTNWYYRYALTLPIAKPDPAFSWHSELNTSLGTTIRNHDSEHPNRFVLTNLFKAYIAVKDARFVDYVNEKLS